ncbi:MAG TPA: MATE family efflux transporter [Gammaproteobacteria bacterium]|nr:MATE family efflux transporter [Gammaproteobacteria bacterium]
MVWGLFSVIAFNLADTYFIGQLGANELAAISFTTPIVLVITSLAIGLGTGTSSILARTIGQGDRDRLRRIATDSLILTALVSVLLMWIGLKSIESLFSVMGAEPAVLVLIHEYMGIWYLGLPFLVLPMVGNSSLRAQGNTLFPSLIMFIAALVNVILDPILIFGLFGAPRLEMQGAAIATVLARMVTLIAALWMLGVKEKLLVFAVPGRQQLWQSWVAIFHVGLPAAGTNVVVPLGMAVVTALMASFGANAVAALGVATRIEAFSIISLFALASSLGPFVGQNAGAGKRARVIRVVQGANIMALVWGLFIAAILFFISEPVVKLFSENESVIAMAKSYLIIISISYGFQGMLMVNSSTFNALGKPLPSTLLSLGRMFLLYVPMALVAKTYWGTQGIFIVAALANVISGVVAFAWAKSALTKMGYPLWQR